MTMRLRRSELATPASSVKMIILLDAATTRIFEAVLEHARLTGRL